MKEELPEEHCPECDQVGGLHIEHHLTGDRIGTWSLTGGRLKVPTRVRPWLVCTYCGLRHCGNYDTDSSSRIVGAVFERLPTPHDA